MEDLKKSDIVAEAAEKTKEFRENNHYKAKKLIEHFATVVSITVILLTVILYAFNTGFYRVYNVPAGIIPLDLKSYMPLVLQICGVMMYILYYITAFRTDTVIKRKSINPMRIFYGITILTTLFTYNNFQNAFGGAICIAAAIIIPVIIELIILIRNKPRKDKKVNAAGHRIILEDTISDFLLYDLYIRYGVFIFIIAIYLAPSLGKLKATSNLSYQTCIADEELYAVIADLDDMVLVENAEEEGNVLSIKTTSYRYIPKDNLVLTYREYADVDIIQE